MDALLTPVVTHFLKSFIKTASGEEASKLRVSLSRGVVLHNLELNLDRLTSKLPLRIERAFAKQLTLRISWTALAQQTHPGGVFPAPTLLHHAWVQQNTAVICRSYWIQWRLLSHLMTKPRAELQPPRPQMQVEYPAMLLDCPDYPDLHISIKTSIESHLQGMVQGSSSGWMDTLTHHPVACSLQCTCVHHKHHREAGGPGCSGHRHMQAACDPHLSR